MPRFWVTQCLFALLTLQAEEKFFGRVGRQCNRSLHFDNAATSRARFVNKNKKTKAKVFGSREVKICFHFGKRRMKTFVKHKVESRLGVGGNEKLVELASTWHVVVFFASLTATKEMVEGPLEGGIMKFSRHVFVLSKKFFRKNKRQSWDEKIMTIYMPWIFNLIEKRKSQLELIFSD